MSDHLRLWFKPGYLFYSLIISFVILGFMTPYAAVPADTVESPHLIYPGNNTSTTPESDPPTGMPDFAWSAVLEANQYRLQVADNLGFNSPAVDISTWNTTYSPLLSDDFLSDGDWYWRVRVEDPTPTGKWSTVFRFNKAWATPQNKPLLLAPAEGQALAFFDAPAFSWTAVTGAAAYRFQVAATQDGFGSPLITVDTLATAYQPPERLTNGAYYWRVIPLGSVDQPGTPSDVRSFWLAYGMAVVNGMVPILIAPANEAIMEFTPTFRWTAIRGAEHYLLEYTTSMACDFSSATHIETHQASFTPADPMANNQRYCWRVRAESGEAVGDWSETWHFQKKWDLKPILLTPTHQYQAGLYPLYSWTPVPGAASYQIQIADNPGFDPIYEESTTSNTTYTPQTRYDGTVHYYWRVWPIDGGEKYGKVSDTGEYQSRYDALAPILVYPLYYYPPDAYGQYTMHPAEDRSVAYPIFLWHRVIVPAPVGGIYAAAYRIQVDGSYLFDSIDWQYDTENTSATPTDEAVFVPIPEQEYYWRVCPLEYLGSECRINPATGTPWWSQVWKARFDQTRQLTPSAGEAPRLLRPQAGQESVEATPLLEWWPFEGATQYEVEVSRDPDFTTIEISQLTNIPAYSPRTSLAQRSLGRTDYGTFYWHVRGFTPDGWSSWSETWRFQIASQSEWRFTRTPGSIDNQLLIGSDPYSDVPTKYDLTTLFAAQSSTAWFFGFDATPPSTDMTYVIYIDLDNVPGSGGGAPPERNYQVATSPEHQPEYVIYIDDIGGTVNADNAWIYAWEGEVWGVGKQFSGIGAGVENHAGYVEINIPSHEIGMDQETSSASLILFSVDPASGTPQDSTPSDPQVPGQAVLTRFTAVSERLNLVYPPQTASGDPSSVASLLPFYWDWPTGSDGATPFAGSVLQVDLDKDYTPPHEATFQISSNTSYFSEHAATLLTDLYGDNTYYWRVQPRYMLSGFTEAFGSWTGGWSFQRLGLAPENLQSASVSSIVTFSWDMAEGAQAYQVQVATDPGYNNLVIDTLTRVNAYTPPDTLPLGWYYWRVRIIRYGDIANGWSEGAPFEFSLPQPEGFLPAAGEVVHGTPTYCWNPIELTDEAGRSSFTARQYHVQVSTDPSFSNTYDSTDTANHCWTPARGYTDGTYYWRVAMYDGNGHLGAYSQLATFTKQYPSPPLVSPVDTVLPRTPTFIWSALDGATSYVLEVSHYPTFYPLYDTQETFNTQYTPISNYAPNRVYYWRVAMCDHAGQMGAFSTTRIIIGEVHFSYNPLVQK